MNRVLIWATHLQTDILALALHLDACEDVELMVVTPGVATFLSEPIAKARPLRAPLLDRDDASTIRRAQAFFADVVIADNHLPPPGLASRLFYMWHGLGWKARGKIDLKVFYARVKRLTGIDPRRPNPRFMAQCYGPPDRNWRIENWGLAPENCAMIGMTFSDLLLGPPYDRAALAGHYRIDTQTRPTVLLSITWHYGGIFAQAGSAGRTLKGLATDDAVDPANLDFLQRMIETVQACGANLLICLHERKRFEASFINALEQVTAPHDFVELRFKDEHPDNLTDLLVADVMISNLSSFLTYFYVLRRPAVHILPVAKGMRKIERRLMLTRRFGIRLWSRAEAAWMNDPTDVGGAVAENAEEAVRALEMALADLSIGEGPTGEWLGRHVIGMDGHTAARFKQAIDEFCATPL